MTKEGIHIVSGPELLKFFKKLGRMEDRDLVIHPEDDEGDRFIELAKPFGSLSDAERHLEKEMEDHGYTLSPRSF
jgi:hypothetical protein